MTADPDGIDLPMLPRAAAEVLALRDRDDVDAAHVSKLIHRDPALAAHVLRAANSPMFRGRNEIVTLQQAVARLGMKQLTDMVIAASVGATVFRVRGHEPRLRRLWNISLIAGLAAKEVARHLRKNVEVSFLCGLLHNIGVPIALHGMAEMQKGHGLRVDESQIDGVLTDLVPAIGAALVRRWRFSPDIGSAVRFYRQPEHATNGADPARLTNLAVAMAEVFADPPPEADEAALDQATAFQQLHQKVLTALNIYPDEVAALLAKGPPILESVQAMNQ